MQDCNLAKKNRGISREMQWVNGEWNDTMAGGSDKLKLFFARFSPNQKANVFATVSRWLQKQKVFKTL